MSFGMSTPMAQGGPEQLFSGFLFGHLRLHKVDRPLHSDAALRVGLSTGHTFRRCLARSVIHFDAALRVRHKYRYIFSMIFKGGGEMLGCCLDVDGGCCLYEFWDEYAHGPRRARTTSIIIIIIIIWLLIFQGFKQHMLPPFLTVRSAMADQQFLYTFRRCFARSVIQFDADLRVSI